MSKVVVLILIRGKQMLLPLTCIVLMAVAASYTFQHTETAYQISGLCFYRYFVYASAVFFGYVCFSHFNKYMALAFSFALSAVALSPFSRKAMELFPYAVPLIAALMGLTAVLIVPRSKGRGFFEFLAVLILPSVLAESRIGGSSTLLATIESVSYYELAAITAIIVGGYFYLRYTILANLNCLELLSNGGDERDVTKVSKLFSLLTLLVVVSASGTAVVLMVASPVVAAVLRTTIVATPINVLILAITTGLTITTTLYTFNHTHKEHSVKEYNKLNMRVNTMKAVSPWKEAEKLRAFDDEFHHKTMEGTDLFRKKSNRI